MRRTLRWTIPLLCAVLARAATADGGGELCVAGRVAPPGGLDRIALRPVGFPAALGDVPALAAAMWNAHGCNAGRFPSFVLGEGGDRTLTVRWIAGLAPAEPGVCGRFSRDEIQIFAATIDPASRQMRPCGDRPRLAETLAHELGHALGLLDVRGRSCDGRIMSQLRLRADGEIAPRGIHAEECALADRRFETLAERLAPPFVVAGLPAQSARLTAPPAALAGELPRRP